MWCTYASVIVVTVLFIASKSDGCNCPNQPIGSHPQTALCTADFVFKGTREEDWFERKLGAVIYKVKVNEVIKLNKQWPATRYESQNVTEYFNNNLCLNVTCESDEVCERDRCSTTTCIDKPRCVHGGMKRGLCPDPQSIRTLPPVEDPYECNKDTGCDGYKICCHTEETSQCMNPFEKIDVKRNDIVKVLTAPIGEKCAFKLDKKWILSGVINVYDGEVYYELCGWNKPAPEKTFKYHKSSFFKEYNMNCEKCKIGECPNKNCLHVCEAGADQCYSNLSCEYNKRRKQCQWENSRDARKCIK